MKIFVVIENYVGDSPKIVQNTGFSSLKEANELVEARINKWLNPLAGYRKGNAIYSKTWGKVVEFLIEPVEFSGCQVQFSP